MLHRITGREPLFRWWEHYKHSGQQFGRAMQETGIDNWSFEVIEKWEKTDKSIEEMHKLETSYIQKYNSIENGYNCMVSSN